LSEPNIISQEWADWWEEAASNLPEQATADEIATVFSLLMEVYGIRSSDIANHVFKVLYYSMQEEVLGSDRTLH